MSQIILSARSLDLSAPRRERLALFGCLLAFALLYLLMARQSLRMHAVWSPDAWARFAMIRNWQEQGNLIYLHYDNADVDPQGLFHPLGLLNQRHLVDGYIVHLPRGFCTTFRRCFPSSPVCVIACSDFLVCLCCLSWPDWQRC